MNDKIDQAYKALKAPSKENFTAVFDSYSTVFQNQTDLIRDEIALCITYELYQAAIMLTNHLIEKFLRDVIVIEESGITKMTPENQKEIKAAYKKRGSSSLDNLTDEAKKLQIITPDQHEKLKEYIKTIRNPYSHGSSFQILKDIEPVETITASFSGKSEPKISKTQINSYPPLQALFQGFKAKEDALEYFNFVESILFAFYNRKNGNALKKRF